MILIVDDDVKIVALVRRYLERAGFDTAEAYDGAAALEICRRLGPDLVVLDWMLPRLDGLELLPRLRQETQVPVLMLTARIDVRDRIEGLESGADDYLTKPFHPEELVARVRALLRRRGTAHPDAEVQLRQGLLSIDVARRAVTLAGRAVPALTAIEFRLLQTLAEYPGQVCTREFLLEQVYSFGEKYVLERTIDAHIAKVRGKLREVWPEGEAIATVRGVGYRLAADAP